ncbi:MAG: hypothetical protein LBQ38_13125 [Spirochaetaceae bacterium]|jgi:heptaprenyl diphosphate synthase|nr:hypothetical protein [Spirochaetaceae bacterium]
MERLKEFRAIRQAGYQRLFSSRALCLAGFCAMPALLFNPSPLFRVAQFLFFWFLLWLSGKKNNPLITIFTFLGILVCNLLVPYGRVLFSLGVFKITAGSLLTGLHRAATLEGLFMLSRLSIRPDLRLPGRFGALIGESFRLFALITERKHRITRSNFAADIDGLLIELSEENPPSAGLPTVNLPPDDAPAASAAEAFTAEASAAKASTAPEAKPPSPVPGIIILLGVLILTWLPWLRIVDNFSWFPKP